MNVCRKFFLFAAAVALVLTAACSSTSPTQAKTVEGYWMDNAGNSTTIDMENGQYAVHTVYYMLGSRSQNSLISTSNDNGVLTWKYCPPAKPCITLTMVAYHADTDTIDVTWANDNGESGTMTLTRTNKGDPFTSGS